MSCAYALMLPVRGAEIYTIVLLPEKEGKFPTVLKRSPYVDAWQDKSDEEILAAESRANHAWTDAGYAVVYQHCRGRGRSSGDCIPYLNEREDGLAMQEWVRRQPFYNGELFLSGGSYCCSVHYTTAPFAPDIRGAVFSVQDTERYNCNYRNGFFKIGLHGGWYVRMYKHKTMPEKAYTADSYRMLPLSDFSERVLGEHAPDLDGVFAHPEKDDPFWDTHLGGGETRGVLNRLPFPALIVSAFFDIYTGGIFDMWNAMEPATREKCALLVTPYSHDFFKVTNQPVEFENGLVGEAFPDYEIRWFDAIRGKGKFPFAQNRVTYYAPFSGGWRCGDFAPGRTVMTVPFGNETLSYDYDPMNPATFRGGLSVSFAGTAYQDPPGQRQDILTFYSDLFDADTMIIGKMAAHLTVRSDCEDTCFYIRVSLVTPSGDYGLRDDIHALSEIAPEYVPGTDVGLDFSFDEIAVLAHRGEKLRIDVSSSSMPHYIPHTNYRGLFSVQTKTRTAHNTVVCASSRLTVPTEKE